MHHNRPALANAGNVCETASRRSSRHRTPAPGPLLGQPSRPQRLGVRGAGTPDPQRPMR